MHKLQVGEAGQRGQHLPLALPQQGAHTPTQWGEGQRRCEAEEQSVPGADMRAHGAEGTLSRANENSGDGMEAWGMRGMKQGPQYVLANNTAQTCLPH